MSPKRIPDPKDPELCRINGVYYYRGTPTAKKGVIEKSLGVSTRGLAIQKKKELLISLRGLDPKKKEYLFSEAVSAVLAKYDQQLLATPEEFKHKVRKTRSQVAWYLNHFLNPFFGHYPARLINDSLWNEYIASEIASVGEMTAIGTKKKLRDFKYDRRFMRQCLRAAKLTTIPDLEVPKRYKVPQRVLEPDEIKRLYENAKGAMKGLILGMYKMGFRPGEILKLERDRVNFEKNEIELRLQDVKKNPRIIRMNPQVREMLLERLSKTTGRYVFPSRSKTSRKKGEAKGRPIGERPIESYSKQWARLLKTAGVADCDPYSLRHTFLTECARRVKGGEVTTEEVCKFAGTSMAEFEKTYLHFTTKDTEGVAVLMDIGGAI